MPETQSQSASVLAILQDAKSPVTVFTLSWCSYCHAVKNLLHTLGVPCHTVELDSGVYLDTQLHRRMRTELQQLSGSQTLPQVFVGVDSVGGYTETQAALRTGRLQELLSRHGIDISAP
ncbi:MAG: glutaredoxin domain-containing protein [Pseudohongiella sp.]|uniref:glutaredoxin domain-containing protein n=1 Tax=Pseudohongiella sp. TaxID=1979412 RepID=UPI00349FF52D